MPKNISSTIFHSYSKIIILVGFALVFVLSSVNIAYAQQHTTVMIARCPVNLSVEASPPTVKSWSNIVTVKVKLFNTGECPYSTRVEGNIQLMIFSREGGTTLLDPSTSKITIDSTSSVGYIERQYYFVNGTEFSDQSKSLTAWADVRQTIDDGSPSKDSITRKLGPVEAEIKRDPDTKVSQTPSSTTKDPKTPDPKDQNGNTAPPNNSKNNNQINTGVTAKFDDKGLDYPLGSFFNPLTKNTLPELLGAILKILFTLIGIVSVIIIIIAGFRMVIASGNEAELTKAKAAITWAIIGLIVSLMSFSIVAIIQRLISVGA